MPKATASGNHVLKTAYDRMGKVNNAVKIHLDIEKVMESSGVDVLEKNAG